VVGLSNHFLNALRVELNHIRGMKRSDIDSRWPSRPSVPGGGAVYVGRGYGLFSPVRVKKHRNAGEILHPTTIDKQERHG
jgi:hypothetical protein